jgi:UDP-N-acetylglucosamine diphosphorylase/glucosamine-1-phosphate N-acetyltransferase
MNIIFFEDHKVVRFYPNALTRPLDKMRLGIFTIGEKWKHILDINHATRTLRPWLKGVFRSETPQHDQCYLWINSRFVPQGRIAADVHALQPNEGLMVGDTPVVVRLDGERTIAEYREHVRWMQGFERHLQNGGTTYPIPKSRFPDDVSFKPTSAGTLMEHIWDLFQLNGSQIGADLLLNRPQRTLNHWAVKPFFEANPGNVYLEEDVRIDPGAVLDATEGPIYLGRGSHIMAGALIKGPVAVCEFSTVRMGAKIYEGTTIGPHCKVGGEVSAAIFQAFSNKAHDGYIGNSIIGEWVNIGADTNNSNLKNNYSKIRVYDWESGELTDSGLQFCGLFIADHSKTAINSMLNSGTVCGVSSSILTNNFPPKYIPSFGWVTDVAIEVFQLEKALETMRLVMGRRNRVMSPDYEAMMRYLYRVRDGRLS